MRCVFCKSEMSRIYDYKRFEIVQCPACFSSTVAKIPSHKEIVDYYNGFMFNAKISRKNKIVNDTIRNWFLSFNLPQNARMLDVGGGGGFFSYAFKHFGLGKPYYIDLDQKACDFARKQLKLENVINDDVDNINKYYDSKFDLIYSRHVIKHLIDPVKLIKSAINLLSENGVFILQCPNGISLERLGYVNYSRRPTRELYRANREWSKLKAISTMFSKKIAYGINPINHLWSVTEKGLCDCLNAIEGVTFETRTALLTDKVYSPWLKRKGILEELHSFAVGHTLGRINGGAHLIAIIRKKKQAVRAKVAGVPGGR